MADWLIVNEAFGFDSLFLLLEEVGGHHLPPSLKIVGEARRFQQGRVTIVFAASRMSRGCITFKTWFEPQ
jgi:hypothetical protein